MGVTVWRGHVFLSTVGEVKTPAENVFVSRARILKRREYAFLQCSFGISPSFLSVSLGAGLVSAV
jgi:hypothetical protein